MDGSELAVGKWEELGAEEGKEGCAGGHDGELGGVIQPGRNQTLV